jgi:hypothetical protein
MVVSWASLPRRTTALHNGIARQQRAELRLGREGTARQGGIAGAKDYIVTDGISGPDS